jgi:regulatory protein
MTGSPDRRPRSARRPPIRRPSSPSARLEALRLLARREYTTAEIRSKLADRDFAPDEIESAIASLTAERALDDRRVAASYVASAAKTRGRGRLRIERELAARGLDPAVIREALADLSADDERAAVERYVQRRRARRPLAAAERRRLFQQLVRRGFRVDVILRVLGPAGDLPES